MRAMILAAGRGERLRPLTDRTPKPLLEAGGKPLIAGVIERLRAAGVTDLVVNLGWLGGQIRDRLGDGSALGVSIAYSDEGEDVLETAGGIVKALPLLGPDPFWVVNADVATDFPFAGPPLAAGDRAHFVLVPSPAHVPGGDFGLADGRVVASGGTRLTYSGIGVYRPEFFAGERPVRRPLLPLMQRAVAAGRVSGERYDGRWIDVGTAERLASITA